MSKTAGNSNDVGVTGGDRSTRSRASSSRKCCACQYQQGPHESSRFGKKRTSVKPSKSNAHVNKPKKVGPDVLPSVARAKSSPQLRPDALKKKPKKPVTVSADNSAALQHEAPSSQETEGDVQEIAQTSRTPKIRKVPAIPPNNTTTVKTATPRQIWRKKADLTPRKKPAVSKQIPVKELEDQFSDDDSYEHHITWDGFDEPEYRIGQACCFCELDLGSASSEDVNETEFSTLPVVAMLPCGHAFHVSCLDKAELSDDQGDLICVFCESLM
ncbi:uncharacterized protein LOC141595815 [Silene latifolia]|uniref:uncharacterized protein LOC141595815 n=1 Tax=Silene latifolia TaxID=37657 RepID=UPI003D779C89